MKEDEICVRLQANNNIDMFSCTRKVTTSVLVLVDGFNLTGKDPEKV